MNTFATITHFPTTTAWWGAARPDTTGHRLARCAGRAAASALRAVAFGRSAMLEKRAAQARHFADAAKTAAPGTPPTAAAQNAAQAAEKALACGRAITAGDMAAARRVMDSCGSVYVRGALTVALA